MTGWIIWGFVLLLMYEQWQKSAPPPKLRGTVRGSRKIARYLGISRDETLALLRSGAIPNTVLVDRRYQVPRHDLHNGGH